MLIGDYFPLLIHVQPAELTESAVRDMAASFDTYFARGERYAVLTLSPKDAVRPGAKERKRVADWVNSPRVKECTKRLCVGSATVTTGGALERGMLTALLWLWRPPFPLQAFGEVPAALDYALARLEESAVPLPRPKSEIRRQVLERLRELV